MRVRPTLESLRDRFREVHIGVLTLSATGLAVITLSACSTGAIVRIDGSSTVFPITEAIAEEFGQTTTGIRASIGISGTGGGFKKFCNGETDIADASRAIKPSEIERCASNGISFIELPVAYDGLSVIVHADNDWADFMTVAELAEVWKPDSKVRRWSDIRPAWPDESIFLVGPDTDSGTFDYFTRVINGKSGVSRPDYVASADDNVLVRAVSEEEGALGYLGFAFFAANTDKLRAVAIDGGDGPIGPNTTTIATGDYSPLSRPLFIYVNIAAADRPEVGGFVSFYLGGSNAPVVQQVGYIPLPPDDLSRVRDRFKDRITGSVHQDG